MEPPALLVIGASPALKSRIDAVSFSFPVCFYHNLPDLPVSGSLILLPFPAGLHLADAIPGSQSFIGAGDAEYLPAAFARGASDYLREPWTGDELDCRVERLLPVGPLSLGAGLWLEGSVLAGRNERVCLGRREATLLRELASHPGEPCLRSVLRRVLWDDLSRESRAVDETVSRLRGHLERIGAPGCRPQLRAVRGIGYQFIPGS